jgi:hypothetical protein
VELARQQPAPARGGLWHIPQPVGGTEQPGSPFADLVQMTEQCSAGCTNNGNIPNSGLTYTALQPAARLATSVTRTWTDRDGDFTPDCDLFNPLAQTTTVDFCGQMSHVDFGKDRFNSTLDPKLVNGWRVRPGDWQYGVSVQQQVLSGVAIEAGYNRRWLTHFTATDNLAQGAADFGTFSVTAPVDSDCPRRRRAE